MHRGEHVNVLALGGFPENCTEDHLDRKYLVPPIPTFHRHDKSSFMILVVTLT